MYKWNSQQIQSDLSKIIGISAVEIGPPGGDVDTEHLYIKINRNSETIFACGFITEGYDMIGTPSDVEVEMIELLDGSADGGGGLQSTDIDTGLVFLHVRQYFLNNGAIVVDSMDPYF